MPKADFTGAAAKAKAVLLKYGYKKPPVDPERIAHEEGLRVVYADFEGQDAEKVSGFFRLKDMAIVVNNDITDTRITFTIAHELGHFFLHQAYIKSNNYRPMPRTNDYEGEKPIEEIEADTFAANLLVPLSMLRDYKDFASVGGLARLFFVSEETVRNRLDLLKRYPKIA